MYILGYIIGSIATVVTIKFGLIYSFIPIIIGSLIRFLYSMHEGE